MTTVSTLQVRPFQTGHSGLAHAEAAVRTRDRGSFHPTSWIVDKLLAALWARLFFHHGGVSSSEAGLPVCLRKTKTCRAFHGRIQVSPSTNYQNTALHASSWQIWEETGAAQPAAASLHERGSGCLRVYLQTGTLGRQRSPGVQGGSGARLPALKS